MSASPRPHGIQTSHSAPPADRFCDLGMKGGVTPQLLAGALDFVENAAMQRTIDAVCATTPWLTIGSTASAIKWLLILTFTRTRSPEYSTGSLPRVAVFRKHLTASLTNQGGNGARIAAQP